MRDVVIVGAARTPQGKMNGALSSLSAVELGVVAAKAALTASGVDRSEIKHCLFGQVLQAGAGQNPARQIAIGAGLGWDVVSTTINKLCLSGSSAIIDAARLVQAGEADVVLAGGTESMSQAPHLMVGSRKGYNFGDIVVRDHMALDGLADAFDKASMGACTQVHTSDRGIDRAAQDEIAAESHRRAAAATASGTFTDEIAPVTMVDRKGNETVIVADEGIRPETTTESLARLKPAFDAAGTITAGNSSQISDGAAAVVVASAEYAQQHGLQVLARVVAWGIVAGPDNSLLSQPSAAITAALAKSNWSLDQLDVIEINEAFASVALQSMKDLGLSSDRVNKEGGAISLGHPIGASGTRLVVHAVHQLNKSGGGKAAIALCGGGGQGDAILLQA